MKQQNEGNLGKKIVEVIQNGKLKFLDEWGDRNDMYVHACLSSYFGIEMTLVFLECDFPQSIIQIINYQIIT